MKKILSIDGGGIRGLIPALVLADIESRTGRAVAQCFDLIAGTSTGGATKALIDGGIFINSPSVSAYAEARKIFPDETEFFLLSLGTGELIRPIAYNEARDWGKVGWLAPLLSCMFDGVADAADYQMKMFLGNRYIRLQTNLAVASDDMDNTTNGNIENLKVEAKKLLKTHKGEIETVCGWLQQ